MMHQGLSHHYQGSIDFNTVNIQRISVHCLESGCDGKYIPIDIRDFPWDFAPLSPQGCKIPAPGNLGTP